MTVLIIGGGASGMVAAITARRLGAQVTILEKNPRLGKKLLATGNGRCNLTNIDTCSACFNGATPDFVEGILSQFNVKKTISYFEKLGITHKVEDAGKVFPMSDQASSVLDVLRYELEQTGINVVYNARVTEIRKKQGSFELELEDGNSQGRIKGHKVILAAGGKAMPVTGSNGDGFRLAHKLGHRIKEVFPALVPLKLEGKFFKSIAGVKIIGTAHVLDGDRTMASDRGDLLFTNYGISGPPILQISRKAGELLRDKGDAVLCVTVIDTMSRSSLGRLLDKRFHNAAGKTIEFSLVGLLNKRLIPVLLKEAGIKNMKTPVENLSVGEREKILDILIDWRFKITGTTSWPNAQVTAGGVDTREVDKDSLESKIVKGLYFTGEVLDIDGACGGYNLQWAWSSGYVAGQNAAQQTS
jgi:predicted Rossmann fold flavoprotein